MASMAQLQRQLSQRSADLSEQRKANQELLGQLELTRRDLVHARDELEKTQQAGNRLAATLAAIAHSGLTWPGTLKGVARKAYESEQELFPGPSPVGPDPGEPAT